VPGVASGQDKGSVTGLDGVGKVVVFPHPSERILP
jgi:hypothetical protein